MSGRRRRLEAPRGPNPYLPLFVLLLPPEMKAEGERLLELDRKVCRLEVEVFRMADRSTR